MAPSSTNDVERTICRSIELDNLHAFTSLVAEDYGRLIAPSPRSHKQSLLSHGVDVRLAGGKATTWPLAEAVRTDDPEIVRILGQYADTEYKGWAIRSQVHDGLNNRASILSILKGDST